MRKEDLKVGDVILYPPHKDDILALLIAMFTDGEVNHAALLYDNNPTELKVIESVLNGVGINDVPVTGTDYYLKVFRKTDVDTLKPVIMAAERYNGNEYPYANLGLLAILILFGKKTTGFKNQKMLFRIAKAVTLGLMLLIQKTVHKGRNVMSCSQFVAQSFSDAGENFSLKFSKLLVDEDGGLCLKNNSCGSESETVFSQLKNLNTEDYEVLVDKEFGKENRGVNMGTDMNSLFVSCLEDNEQQDSNKTFPLTENSAFRNIALDLLSVMDTYITGNKKGRPVGDILRDFRSDKYRNFFVTPEDININCTNIEYIGNI